MSEEHIDAEFVSEPTTAVAVIDKADLVPGFAVPLKEAKARLAEFNAFVAGAMTENVDYGKIPGAGTKKVLLKPGAEKLLSFGGFSTVTRFIDKTEDWDKGFFSYTVAVDVVSKRTGLVECTGIGNANSRESKWAYRWVREDQLPHGVDKSELMSRDSRRDEFEFKFAIEKAETTGQYGKPAEYWQKWKNAIEMGDAVPAKKKTKTGKELDGYRMAGGGVEYRLPNPDIYDLVNTILKMAKKRALVDGAIQAMRAATDFTQDIENEETNPTPGMHDSYADAFGDDDAPPVESAVQRVADSLGGTVEKDGLFGDISPNTQGMIVEMSGQLKEIMLSRGLTESNFSNFVNSLLKGRTVPQLSDSAGKAVVEGLKAKIESYSR